MLTKRVWQRCLHVTLLQLYVGVIVNMEYVDSATWPEMVYAALLPQIGG